MFRSCSLITFACVLLSAVPASAQPAPRSVEQRLDRIRELNGALLGLAPAADRSRGERSVSNLDSQAGSILRERAAELQAIMESDPARALEIAFSDDLSKSLREQYPEFSDAIEVRGRWSGGSDYVVLDAPDHDQALHRVRIQTGEGWVNVHFAGVEPEGLGCGQMLETEGLRLGDHVVAAEARVAAAATTAVPCSPLGEQKIAVFMVTFPGVTPPATVTPAMLQAAYFGDGPVSLNKYWREGSMSKVWATGQVFPWRTLSRAYTCDEYYELWNEVLATMDPEVDFRQFNRIFIVFPKPASCGWAGIANVGCRVLSTADGTVNASLAWMVANSMTTNNNAVMLAAHEAGHNLGLSHAASRDFGDMPLGAPGTAGTLSEYGDKFSSMGYWNLGHYSARHKQQLGWLSSSEIRTVNSSGTYQIQPASSILSGVKALKVARGAGSTTNWVWLESRQPVGSFDSTLRAQAFSGALVHYQDSSTGNRSNLLDYTETTATFDDPAKVSGGEWVDPYSNLRFKVNSATKDGMSVSVTLGPPPCTTAAPSLAISPANPTVSAGAAVTYTATLKNNDSSTCAASTFTLASAAPAGWPTTLSAPALTLAPGESGTATITKTAGSTAGTFAVTATATRGSSTVTGSANCTVTVATTTTTKPVVTSWPSKPTFAVGEVFSFTIKATKDGQPVYPGSAAIILVRPNGTHTYRILPLGPDGTLVWTYQSSDSKDMAGTYSVKTVLTAPARAESISSITITAAQ